MTVLTEHRLRVGTRDVLLLEGPEGWGESSPIPGYPCDPAKAHDAAVEAAVLGYPPRVRDQVSVNALVRSADFDADALSGFPAVKVKMRVPADRDLVARMRPLHQDGEVEPAGAAADDRDLHECEPNPAGGAYPACAAVSM